MHDRAVLRVGPTASGTLRRATGQGNPRPHGLLRIVAFTFLLHATGRAADAAAAPNGAPTSPQISVDPTQWVGRFDGPAGTPPSPWRVMRLNSRVPPTLYTDRRWQGISAVEAVAHASMALLVRPLKVDRYRTPVLGGRWVVDAPVGSADMTTRAGDDFAARVYVAFRLPRETMSLATGLKLRLARGIYGEMSPDAAVNYVWDNSHPVGTERRSAYSDRAQMIVLRSGTADAGQWVTERRDVAADFRQAFGNIAMSATLLAVASDTDNTRGDAHAGFADLHFVALQSPCRLPLPQNKG